MPNKMSFFGTNKENLSWELSEDGRLLITGSGQMEGFDEHNPDPVHPTPWHDYKDTIRSIEIVGTGAGIKEIEAGLFAELPKLVKVSIKNLAKINKEAFFHCTKLQEVKLGSGVSFIGESSFSKCDALRSVTIDEREGSNKRIVIEDNAFRNCGSLKTVSLPDGMIGDDIAGNAFSQCVSLNELKLGPLFDSDTFRISTDTSPDLHVEQEPKVVIGYSNIPVMEAYRDKCGVSLQKIPKNSAFYPGISMHVGGANALLHILNDMAKAEGKFYIIDIKTEWINGKAHVFPGGDKPYLEYRLGTDNFLKVSDAFACAGGIEPFGQNVKIYMEEHLKPSFEDRKQVQEITGEKVSVRDLMTDCSRKIQNRTPKQQILKVTDKER